MVSTSRVISPSRAPNRPNTKWAKSDEIAQKALEQGRRNNDQPQVAFRNAFGGIIFVAKQAERGLHAGLAGVTR